MPNRQSLARRLLRPAVALSFALTAAGLHAGEESGLRQPPANGIDADDRWAGGNLTLVQTGDQIDRGDDDRDVLDLFARLAEEARAAGGRVVALNGNHEIMNVQGDFRYVTPGAIETFAGVSPRSPLARSAKAPYIARAAAFLPGGAYAVQFAERDVVAYLVRWTDRAGVVREDRVATGARPSARLADVRPGSAIAVKALDAQGLEGWDWATVLAPQ